tara:strand:- start:354 stop:1751 length:1398 start_codon:yes stop_codon:yes gene_type:complete
MRCFLKLCLLLLLVCSSSKAYEQQYQIGDTGENGGTVISVVVEAELTETITEVIGDFLETTEVWVYTETVVEEIEQTTYQTVTTTTEVQTDNLTDTYTDTNINVVGNSYGMTGAEITTGNQSQGGGTRVYDIDLSEYNEIQEIDYGSKVYSHISNQNVPACNATNRDCRDDFKISVRLYEGNTLKEQYTHNYTGITWVGSQDYSYNQDVSQISFDNAELELYGIDRGYNTGYYGVGFSDIFFNVTYNQITEIINEIINTVELTIQLKTNEYIYESSYIAPPPEDIIEIEIETPDDSISFEIDITEEFEIDIPVVEEIQEIEIIEVAEVEMAEAEVEAEIEQELESIEEPIEEIEVEETEEVKDQEEKEEKPETIKPKEIKQKIANKLMAKQKDKMSTQSQTTQLALMVVLSDANFSSYLEKQIQDTQFYQDSLYADQNVIIDYQAGIMGYLDLGIINEMVDQQWK